MATPLTTDQKAVVETQLAVAELEIQKIRLMLQSNEPTEFDSAVDTAIAAVATALGLVATAVDA